MQEVINFIAFIATQILNSFRIRSLFSNFLYTIKKIDRSNIEQIKKQTEVKSKLLFLIKLVRWLQLIHQANSAQFAVV